MLRKKITAQELGIDLRKGGDRALFEWFPASFLLGKRAQQTAAAQASRVLVDTHQLDSPLKVCRHSHRQLVAILGEGHDVRDDDSTAERLLALCRTLTDGDGSKLSRLRADSGDAADLERRWLAFKGVGPRTLRICMREAGQVFGMAGKAHA